MRYFEISSGFRVPVSSEEKEIIAMCSDKRVPVSEMDERQEQVAHEMTVRGLLLRSEDEGNVYYETDRMDLWRF